MCTSLFLAIPSNSAIERVNVSEPITQEQVDQATLPAPVDDLTIPAETAAQALEETAPVAEAPTATDAPATAEAEEAPAPAAE